MTFESMIENAPVANENANPQQPIVNEAAGLAVKVSFGDDIRRATFNGVEFLALRDLSAKLFELNSENVVLRYQDNDGDKITMSSNGELAEALSIAKDKNILRLFVDVKIPPPTEEERHTEENAFPCWRRFGGPMRGFGRGGFGGRGGWMGPGHHGFGGPMRGGFPHHGPRGGFGGHHGPHTHPFGGPHGFQPQPGHFVHSFNPATNNVQTEQVQTDQVPAPVQAGGSPSVNYNVPRTFGHGTFSPADGAAHQQHQHHPIPFSPYARHAFKHHKHEMKQQIEMMKMNAVTAEDYQAIKEFKEQVRAECKARWHECKAEKKAWKKGEWKEKKEKREKGERKEKDLVARHVADVTIPDNSELPADSPVTKTWRLRNAGLLAWPADSQLLFVSRRGDNLNGPERVFVGAVEPNQEVEVSVTFITPSEPGRYIGYYRMATSEGVKFGQRVWVSFIIPATAANKNVEMQPTAPVDPTAPLLPTSPLLVPLAPASDQTPKAPEAADDITMD